MAMTQPIQQFSHLHFRSEASQSSSLSSTGKVGLIVGLIAGVTLIVLLVTYIVLRLKRGPVITPRSFLPHPSKKTASLRNLPSADIERGLRSRGTDRSGSLATTTRTAAEKSSVRSGGRRPAPSSHPHSHPHRKGTHPSSLAKEAGFQKAAGGGGSGRGWGRKGTTRDFHTHADPHGPAKPLNTSRDLNHTVAVTMPVSVYATPHGRLRDPVRVPPYYPTVSPRGPPSPAVSRLTTSTRSSAALPSARFMPGMRKIDG